MTDTPLHERPETQLALWLSYSHMPCGGMRDMPSDVSLGFISNRVGTTGITTILVSEPTDDLPDWLAPIMRHAYDNDYSLIVFSLTGEVVDYLPTYGD